MLRLTVVPCSASWVGMQGDSDRRHCPDCERDVHDLSMRTEPEALALLERGACVRYRTDERGAVRLAARSFCVAAVTLGACTPTGRDDADDVLAVEPADDLDVGILIDHDLPGVEHIERLSREITVQGHFRCEDGICLMGGIITPRAIASKTMGIPAAVVVVPDAPAVYTDAPRSRPSPARTSRASKRALRRDRRDRKRLHRAAGRADRKARRAARRFARAHRFVAKLKSLRGQS